MASCVRSRWATRLLDVITRCSPQSRRLAVNTWMADVLGLHETEVKHLSRWLPPTPRRRFVDAGANIGCYTYTFSPLFERTLSFEPQEDLAEGIEAWAKYRRVSVRLERCGLADRDGLASLHIPVIQGRVFRSHLGGHASLEPVESTHETLNIPIRRLDSFELDDVDFLKVDVEGAEVPLLEGSQETIARCRPVVLIEVNHHAAVFGYFRDRGYRAGYLDDAGNLVELPVNEKGPPVDSLNYLFWPRERAMARGSVS